MKSVFYAKKEEDFPFLCWREKKKAINKRRIFSLQNIAKSRKEKVDNALIEFWVEDRWNPLDSDYGNYMSILKLLD